MLRIHVRHKMVEGRAVMKMHEVTKLVHNNTSNAPIRHPDEVFIERDMSGGRAGAPSPLHLPEFESLISQAGHANCR